MRVPRCGPHLLSGGRGTARRLLPQAFGKWEGGKRLKKRRGRQALSPPFLAPFFPPPAGCVRRRVAFTGHCRLTPAWAWRVRIWQGWCGDGGGAACAPAGGAWFFPPPPCGRRRVPPPLARPPPSRPCPPAQWPAGCLCAGAYPFLWCAPCCRGRRARGSRSWRGGGRVCLSFVRGVVACARTF